MRLIFRRGRVHWSVRSIALQTASVWSVIYIPFIHSRHNAKDRSLGVGRDIIVVYRGSNALRAKYRRLTDQSVIVK